MSWFSGVSPCKALPRDCIFYTRILENKITLFPNSGLLELLLSMDISTLPFCSFKWFHNELLLKRKFKAVLKLFDDFKLSTMPAA